MTWTRRDDRGLDPAGDEWESEMVEYPCVFEWDGQRYMLYNGNGYGRTGMLTRARGQISDFCLMQKSRSDPAYCREHFHHAVDH